MDIFIVTSIKIYHVQHELTEVSLHDVVHVIAVDSPLKLEMLAKRLTVTQHLKQAAVRSLWRCSLILSTTIDIIYF